MTPISNEGERLISLLERDIVRTLGAGHQRLVHDTVAKIRQLDPEDDGQKIVDDVQQYFHDTFTDITWPTCPRHRRHPLWYRAGAWWCEEDEVEVARLGQLGG